MVPAIPVTPLFAMPTNALLIDKKQQCCSTCGGRNKQQKRQQKNNAALVVTVDHTNYKEFVTDIQDICRYPRIITPGNKWFVSHKNTFLQFKSEVVSFSNTKTNIFVVTDKILGSGAFGVVKLCYDLLTHKSYALKIQNHYDLEDMERIKNQIEGNKLFGMGINKELQKDFYGPILHKETRKIYYVMPLAECSFFDKLKNKNMNLLMALSHMYTVILQIHEMHQQNKIHMDIKLDNILLLNNKAYLADFGLIKDFGTVMPTFVIHGKNKSTHMPPECFYSETLQNRFFVVSRAIDLWSVGTMIESIFAIYKEPIQMSEIIKFTKQKLLRTNPKNRKPLSPLLYLLKTCVYNLYIDMKK